MAQLDEAFDASGVEPRDNFDPIPPGKYVAEAVQTDFVDTKDGTGKIINITWRVTEGDFEGRQIWDRINYKNKSEKAQMIGQQALAEIMAATGIRGGLSETDDLLGIPIVIKVAIEQDKTGQYPDKNKVSRYAPMSEDGSAPAAAKPAATATRPAAAARPAPAAAAGASRPWGDRAKARV